MDKKHISQTWVSIMYQRFEAAYQEVDEFMNKVCLCLLNNIKKKHISSIIFLVNL